MKNEELYIAETELEILKKHLKASALSEHNKNQLLKELSSAKIFKDSELPDDAIRIDSRVEIEEEKSGKKFNFQIVQPAHANMKENKLSVFAPIGIALLGYRTGAMVQWEMPDGMKTFKILNVSHVQPLAH
jgi:regulator of nucleoside diphosphate kinase